MLLLVEVILAATGLPVVVLVAVATRLPKLDTTRHLLTRDPWVNLLDSLNLVVYGKT